MIADNHLKVNMKNSNKFNNAAEAIITVIATPVIVTMTFIGMQSLLIPKYFGFTPISQIVSDQDSPALWTKYKLLIAQSSTYDYAKVGLILLFAFGLFKATEGSANRTYFRLFLFIDGLLKRNRPKAINYQARDRQ